MRKEHKPYFDALERHPRQLVGETVPSIKGEGEEKLRDAADAKDWQEAVEQILVNEVADRAGRAMEESSDFLTTVHQSIELFQNNTDLIPHTKDFDVELANRFTEMAQPYEMRHEGKLQGYTIQVQPLIDSVRKQLVKERANKPAPSPAPPVKGEGASSSETQATKPEDAPQGGIPSKAGSGDSTEDFSTLFGTIGLPNLRI